MDRLLIITGLSGSGKSLAGKSLEDLGFYCVDNLPVQLIPPFFDLVDSSRIEIKRAALVVDVREGEFIEQFPRILAELRNGEAPVELVFFECSEAVQRRRFSETRRPHPMAGPEGTLDEAIAAERAALEPIRHLADRIVDTSAFTVHQLRGFMKTAFGEEGAKGHINVNVLSFGFKYGIPAEADLVFDVRFLPNPYFVDGLRSKNGRDAEVLDYLERQEHLREFRNRLFDLLEFLLPRYVEEGKSYLTVAIGCTGGKHRSVALSEQIASFVAERGVRARANHRDLGKE